MRAELRSDGTIVLCPVNRQEHGKALDFIDRFRGRVRMQVAEIPVENAYVVALEKRAAEKKLRDQGYSKKDAKAAVSGR